jgi:uncharacterized protein (DUF169 family)
MINELKKYFGTNKCTGIKLNDQSGYVVNKPSVKMRFCEAVKHSFDVPLLIDHQNLDCIGAERNLGYLDDDEAVGKHISKNTSIPYELIREVLAETTPIKFPLTDLVLGITEEMEKLYTPDFYIAFTSPLKSMQLTHQLARIFGVRPFIAPFSIMSICGNVFARGCNTGMVCISFGCPESRKYGGVSNNEVVVGLPGDMAMKLIMNN